MPAEGDARRPRLRLPSAWLAGWQRRSHERDEVRRFTRRRRRRRNLWLGIGAIAAFVVVFVAVAVWSPTNAVREVRVVGVERLSEGEVAALLAPLQGRPLAAVGETDVGELLAPVVLVQSYSVQRVPPSTLVVGIVERVPVGIVADAGGWRVLDAVGVELWRQGEAAPDLPVIESGGAEGPAFEAAAAVSLALSPEFRSRVATIRAASIDDVVLELRDGVTVVWGSAEQSDRKAQVLAALVQATGGEASHYDVSSPDTPVSR